MPDSSQRARLGAMVRGYVEGPGHPNILDMLAREESAFAFATRKRRAFQKAWFTAVDEIVTERQQLSPPNGHHHRDLLDLLLAARDTETGEALSATEARDQCATMIFGGFETTARLLFWASYLLTLDLAEQERLRTEVAAFRPERLSSLDDLANWPRLRMTLLAWISTERNWPYTMSLESPIFRAFRSQIFAICYAKWCADSHPCPVSLCSFLLRFPQFSNFSWQDDIGQGLLSEHQCPLYEREDS